MLERVLPKITIVTVVYNGESVIEGTIISILEQTYPNIEYWVIDGASKDKTLEIVNKYSSQCKLISEPDSGVYDAMNKGIEKASGEWILFMNAGDHFYSDRAISDIFEAYNEDSNYSVIYGDAEFRLKNIAYICEASDDVNSNQYMPFSHQAAFVKTSVAKQIKFDLEYKIAADTAFFLRLVREGHQMQHIHVVVCSYNALEGLSADNEVKRSEEIIALQTKWNNIDPESKHFKNYLRTARIKQLLRKIIPRSLWIILRERSTRKQHHRITKIG